MYLYGKNSVLERLKADPGSIRRIFLQDNFDAPHIIDVIKSAKIEIKRVSEKELTRVKHADRLQGIVAEVGDFKYTPFGDLLYDPERGQRQKLTFIFLDGINDPHNLGSIMRVAACFGGFSIVIPRNNSCEVNDTVMHVASGGENFIPVSMVNNMTTDLLRAKKEGYWIVGAVVKDGAGINNVSLPFPMCLVLGSEGKGIRHGVNKYLDLRVSLPMRGTELSFNVAMACAIFCHEISRQKAAK